MPRAARIDMPNLLQHVIVRGIEKRDIFTNDADRHDFVAHFSNLLATTKTECLEEIAFRKEFIGADGLQNVIDDTPKSTYRQYLEYVLREKA